MTHDLSDPSFRPTGEQPPVEDKGPPQGVSLDSFAGPVHVEWDTGVALTPLGQLPFFIDFLKAAGLFDALVTDCPLHYTSPNAPKTRDVLGTAMLSMLSGHKRYGSCNYPHSLPHHPSARRQSRASRRHSQA